MPIITRNTITIRDSLTLRTIIITMVPTRVRKLWIARINAAARLNGLSYSKLMHGLNVAGINLNRKVLADLAVNDAPAFAQLAEKAKAAL